MKRSIIGFTACLLFCQSVSADSPGEKFLALDASLQQVYWEATLETYEVSQVLMLGKLKDVSGMTAEQKAEFYDLMRNSNDVLDVECVKKIDSTAAEITDSVATFINEHAEDWDFPLPVQILGALDAACHHGELIQ